MKRFVLLLFCLIFFVNCEDDSSKINYTDLQDAFIAAIDFTREFKYPVSLSSEFYNVGSEEENKVTYWSFGETLSYPTNKLILRLLSDRKNKRIPKALFDNIVIDLNIVDSKQITENVVFLSEPFMIDDNRFCFSITKRKEGTELHWVYFVKRDRNEGEYRTFAVYDWQKDQLYDVIRATKNRTGTIK
jgi:hypothetical protein